MSYTKGEWKITERIDNYNIDSRLNYIADVPIKTNNAKANAQLISASPDLLEACKDLVKAYQIKMGKTAIDLRIKLAQDAINKAEGR